MVRSDGEGEGGARADGGRREWWGTDGGQGLGDVAVCAW